MAARGEEGKGHGEEVGRLTRRHGEKERTVGRCACLGVACEDGTPPAACSSRSASGKEGVALRATTTEKDGR